MSVTSATRLAQRRRRMITYLWIVALTAGTISLIYWEMTALLYILATVGVTVLLVVVAISDLRHSEGMMSESAPIDRTGPKGSTSLRT
jgi:hypothetical protein